MLILFSINLTMLFQCEITHPEWTKPFGLHFNYSRLSPVQENQLQPGGYLFLTFTSIIGGAEVWDEIAGFEAGENRGKFE